jgi:hypothetical protein
MEGMGMLKSISHRIGAYLPLLLLALLVSASPSTAAPADEQGGEPGRETARKVYDALLLRPLGFCQFVVSAAVFVPAYPIARFVDLGWDANATDDVIEVCITEPVNQVFRKPLGEL